MAGQRAYAGMSADERRTQRRATLLAAALDLIGTNGFARLTVAGLCTAAGLNERYYYESFATLDDVLNAVFDTVAAELATEILAATAAAPQDARAKARAAIGAAVDVVADDPRKARIAFVEGLTNENLRARQFEIVDSFAAIVGAAGQEFYGAKATLRAGKRIRFAAVHLVGGILQTLTMWLAGGLDMTRDELVDHSADLFVAIGSHLAEPATAIDNAP